MAGSSYAVVIGVESYQQPIITSVKYARSDAEAVADVLVTHLEVPKANVDLWLDHDATQARLKNDIVYQIGQLGPDDRFIFFYAGHGFYAGGTNRITTWETHPTNLLETTTSVEEVLLSPLRKGRCRHSLLFIDACAADLMDTAGFSRDLTASMDRAEFEAFVRSSDFAAAFFSCSPAERSYSLPALKHGIWTYHLLRALGGDAQAAVHRDSSITGQSLADYLTLSVREFITKKTKIRAVQRPYALIGSNGLFEIARIPEQTAVTPLPNIGIRFEDAYFRRRETREYRSLRGFDRKKGHTVPSTLSANADAWAVRLLNDEMVQELESIQGNSKAILKLKRRDIHMSIEGGNGGSIDTEWFRFEIYGGQEPINPGEAFIERSISLRAPHDKLPKTFDSIFPNNVDAVVIPMSLPGERYNDLANALEDLADANNVIFSEARSEHEIVLRFPNKGPMITINGKRGEMVVRGPGRSGCLQLIAAVKMEAVAMLVGPVPPLIGAQPKQSPLGTP